VTERRGAIASIGRGVSLLRAVSSPSNRTCPGGLGVLLLAVTYAAAAAQGASQPASTVEAQHSVADAMPASADARAQAQSEFKRLFDAGDYPAAVEQARRVVDLSGPASTASSEELQVALMNLALAQNRAGDYPAAESNYLRVIDTIEASGRRSSPRLARAYAGLAGTYYAARRYDLAAASYKHAIALLRRTAGLYDEAQLPLLDKQADALTEVGRTDEALRAHRYALRVVAHHQGEESLAFARQLEALGRWYTRVGAYEASRGTLRNAAEVVTDAGGPDSLDLIGPLTAYAENARRWLMDPSLEEMTAMDEQRRSMFQDSMMPAPPRLSPSTIASEGQKALERAAAIVAAHPDASSALSVGVKVQLGDWYQVRQQPDRALPYYRQAWQAVGATPDGGKLRESLFGGPVLLQYDAPGSWNRLATRPADEVELRVVEVELSVTAQGLPRDARIVGVDAEQRLASQALRAAASAIYRPRLVDGEPVATAGVRFNQPFYVQREPAPPPAAPVPSPATPPPPVQGGG
jgi:tetratricopeptide (TPR) repeat protein